MSDRSADGRTVGGTDEKGPPRHRTGGGRALGAGVAGFVAVHLLAVLAFDDPSLPMLVGVEVVAVGSLLVGDAVTAGARDALLAVAGAIGALVAVGVVLGPLGVATWVGAASTLLVAASLRYAGQRYDGFAARGEQA